MHLRVHHIAEHGSREHRPGMVRHTLQRLSTEIGILLRRKLPTNRTCCKSSRPVDMSSRQDELAAVDTGRMRSCQRWEQWRGGGERWRGEVEWGDLLLQLLLLLRLLLLLLLLLLRLLLLLLRLLLLLLWLLRLLRLLLRVAACTPHPPRSSSTHR